MDNDILKLEDEDGNIEEYKVILVFKWYKTNKYYIVYRKNKDDLNNNYEVYANIFDPNNLSELEDIKTDEEWKMIEEKLKEIKEEM